MRTKTDTSYGVIPIRRVGESWEVFLIHQFSRIGDNSYWVFPKGHPNEGETPQQTALRELDEETSLKLDDLLQQPTFDLKYNFVYEGIKIIKTVSFFIGLVTEAKYKIDDDEVREAGWYTLEEASERLDYKDSKRMFAKAKEFIKNYQP